MILSVRYDVMGSSQEALCAGSGMLDKHSISICSSALLASEHKKVCGPFLVHRTWREG